MSQANDAQQQQQQQQQQPAAAAEQAQAQHDDAAADADNVTPWEVTTSSASGIDYEKLIRRFGSSRITPPLLTALQELLGPTPLHRFLRRGLFFSHRDLEHIISRVRANKPFYLYTGRGPSSASMHLGHLIPFMFTKWLQEVFRVPLVIQITTDEKFLWKDMKMEESIKCGFDNVRQILAVGLDPELTFVFDDFDYVGTMYPNVCRVQKLLTMNEVRSAFGFTASHNIGQWAFPAIEAAPALCSSFPHIFGKRTDVPALIPCAIDQDPFFRLMRDVAPKLRHPKCALLHSMFIPGLHGMQSKMSSSDANSVIELTDSPAQIKNKINRHAFSGGRQTREEQEQFGANLEVDIPFHYLQFFLESDEELERIRADYSAGRMMTGQVKAVLIAEIQKVIADVQARYAQITDDDVRMFMSKRELRFDASNPFAGTTLNIPALHASSDAPAARD